MPREPTETGFALFCTTNHGAKPTMVEAEWKSKLPNVLMGFSVLIKSFPLQVYYCTECGYLELYFGAKKG
jgi:hypothetical protein